MKKKQIISENYLEKKPIRADLKWSIDKNGKVTLEIENTGFFNKIAQKFFKKPKTSYVHLDKMGSFIWPKLDGNTDIIELGEKVKEAFGQEAEPLYERLSKYIQILSSYNFVKF